jgi:hypothetical protein
MSEYENYIAERQRCLKTHYCDPMSITELADNTPTLLDDLAILKNNVVADVNFFEVDQTFGLVKKYMKEGETLDAEVYLCRTLHDILVTGGYEVNFAGLADGFYSPSYIGKLARAYVLSEQGNI